MPLFITLIRLFLTIPTIYLLHTEHRFLAALLVITAGVTDWLDGGLARKNNQVSRLGALLDPLVDKVFVLSVLSFFLYRQEIGFLAFALLMVRELSVSFLRSLSVEKGYVMQASYLGKAKAFFEFLALIAICFEMAVAGFLLWTSVFLAYLSMYDYSVSYLRFRGVETR